MKELLVPVNEAARAINTGRTKIYELIAAGELELVKIGKKSLITVASVESLVVRLRERAGKDRAQPRQTVRSSPSSSPPTADDTTDEFRRQT